MHSYHVFVSPKDEIESEDLENQIKEFLDQQKAENQLQSYSILEYTDKGSFGELPSYQIIRNYSSEQDLQAAFAAMRPDAYKEAPHAPLMTMVKDFKVAFSKDIL